MADTIEVAQQSVTVTLVDAGAPVVAVSAADFGVRGDEDTHSSTPHPGSSPAWSSYAAGPES